MSCVLKELHCISFHYLKNAELVVAKWDSLLIKTRVSLSLYPSPSLAVGLIISEFDFFYHESPPHPILIAKAKHKNMHVSGYMKF